MKKRNFNVKITAIMVSACVMLMLLLAGCGGGFEGLSAYPEADMSGYAGLAEYSKKLQFKEVETIDVINMMDEGKSFVLFASYPDCPWCNAMIACLNDAASEEGVKVAYLNTRKDPSWKSNVDISDYDKFAEKFKEYLPKDEDGKPHLYVPDFFVIKEGQVVFEHQGLVPSVEKPKDGMTEEEYDELKTIFKDGIKAAK